MKRITPYILAVLLSIVVGCTEEKKRVVYDDEYLNYLADSRECDHHKKLKKHKRYQQWRSGLERKVMYSMAYYGSSFEIINGTDNLQLGHNVKEVGGECLWKKTAEWMMVDEHEPTDDAGKKKQIKRWITSLVGAEYNSTAFWTAPLREKIAALDMKDEAIAYAKERQAHYAQLWDRKVTRLTEVSDRYYHELND